MSVTPSSVSPVLLRLRCESEVLRRSRATIIMTTSVEPQHVEERLGREGRVRVEAWNSLQKSGDVTIVNRVEQPVSDDKYT